MYSLDSKSTWTNSDIFVKQLELGSLAAAFGWPDSDDDRTRAAGSDPCQSLEQGISRTCPG